MSSIDGRDCDIQRKELIAPFLEDTLTNMNCLKGFYVDFITTFQPILDTMESNNLQLDRFGFQLEIYETNKYSYRGV